MFNENTRENFFSFQTSLTTLIIGRFLIETSEKPKTHNFFWINFELANKNNFAGYIFLNREFERKNGEIGFRKPQF